MKKLQIIKKYILINLFALTISFSNLANATSCGSDDPIIIPLHNWSSQITMSHVVGQMFENELGCTVKYITIDEQAVYEDIRIGNATIEIRVSQHLSENSFNKALDKGGIIDAGDHSAVSREEWWLPNFVIEMCPGLPNWEVLNACSAMFAREDSDGKGVVISGPLEFLHNSERIKSLNMNFEIRNVNENEDLKKELEFAYNNKKAIVLLNWSPNFTDVMYGGRFVEFPPWSNECFVNPSWGLNPDATGDCGSPPSGYIKKAAWHGMTTKWPAAYKALTRINFNTNMIATLVMYVDIDKMSHSDAAKKWIGENQSSINFWFSKNLQ
tara:strand:- start:10 stop:987 length:978 start_codon:yes stop_codon:yes gene_type:complete